MPNFIEPNDYLSRSTILRQVASHRVAFDATNPEHCASLKKFLETGNWGGVMFYPEFPYTDVPTYVMAKYCSHMLGAHRKTSAEVALESSRMRAVRINMEKAELLEDPQESA